MYGGARLTADKRPTPSCSLKSTLLRLTFQSSLRSTACRRLYDDESDWSASVDGRSLSSVGLRLAGSDPDALDAVECGGANEGSERSVGLRRLDKSKPESAID